MKYSQLEQLALTPAPVSRPSAPAAEMPPASRGLRLLQQAKATGFHDRSLLQQSLQAFQQALAANPEHTGALCGMAYLLALSGDPDKARVFVAGVLEQNLDDPLAQSLWTSLGEAMAAPRWAAAVSCDLDARYDALEQMLKARLRYFTETQPPALLSCDAASVRWLRRQQELDLLLDKVRLSLATLERELDTSALEQLCRPLQQLAKRLERHVRAQAEHDRLWQGVQRGRAQGRVLMTELAGLPDDALQVRLEALLDACDAVADGLDTLADAGWQLPDLLAAYRSWIAEIQLLQDQLDG